MRAWVDPHLGQGRPVFGSRALGDPLMPHDEGGQAAEPLSPFPQGAHEGMSALCIS